MTYNIKEIVPMLGYKSPVNIAKICREIGIPKTLGRYEISEEQLKALKAYMITPKTRFSLRKIASEKGFNYNALRHLCSNHKVSQKDFDKVYRLIELHKSGEYTKKGILLRLRS